METAKEKLSEEVVTKILKISHDLRGPFAIFQSFINILEMEEYAMNPDELKEMATHLRTNNETALEKIDVQIKELIQLFKEKE